MIKVLDVCSGIGGFSCPLLARWPSGPVGGVADPQKFNPYGKSPISDRAAECHLIWRLMLCENRRSVFFLTATWVIWYKWSSAELELSGLSTGETPIVMYLGSLLY